MRWTPPAKVDEALGLPVDQLGLHLLRGFRPDTKQHRHNFMIGARNAYERNDVPNDQAEQAVRALAEAYDWLIQQGLLSGVPGTSDGTLFMTRKAIAVLEAPDGAALLRAQARVDVDLHPSIASRVRSQFFLGEYELAALAAMRQVEIRVRELIGGSAGDIGVDLMKRAFNPTGSLRDPNAEKGEQEAMMALFWGAIGVFKNPVSHRQVDYDDPTQASEVVLLADLLLRILDARASTAGS
jgi:uncharacterized protein (TIGR02391 family)